jgi:hypothetical protein
MSRVYTGRIVAPCFDLELEWNRLVSTWELHACRPKALHDLLATTSTNTVEAALLDVIQSVLKQRCLICEPRSSDTLTTHAQVAQTQLLYQARRLQEHRVRRDDPYVMDDLLWK